MFFTFWKLAPPTGHAGVFRLRSSEQQPLEWYSYPHHCVVAKILRGEYVQILLEILKTFRLYR